MAQRVDHAPYPDSPWQDETLVSRLYLDELMSVGDIAEEFGCSKTTIHNWMRRHGIQARSQTEAAATKVPSLLSDPDTLRELYVGEGRSVREIGNLADCASQTVLSWLDRHKIPTRDKNSRPYDALYQQESLRRMYSEQEMSVEDIAADLGCTNPTVISWLRKHGIETRPQRLPSGEGHWRWGGGHTKYKGPDWQQQRERALERDNYECVDCGMMNAEHEKTFDKGLHVHHRRPHNSFGPFNSSEDHKRANALPNLVTLCQYCHIVWEDLPVQLDVRVRT